MTEEEYDALDERLTKTVPTLGHTGTGFFSRKSSQVVCLDEKTARILNAKAYISETPAILGKKNPCREAGSASHDVTEY